MKKGSLLVALLLTCSLMLNAQAGKILGFWLTEEGTSQVEVLRSRDGTYNGKITWLDEPMENGRPKTDDENPDMKLRNRPIMGLQLLNGLRYDSRDGEWVDGTIYDPENGKTYSCVMWFEDNPNVLQIRGYVMGMRFIGRTSSWTKDRKRNP